MGWKLVDFAKGWTLPMGGYTKTGLLFLVKIFSSQIFHSKVNLLYLLYYFLGSGAKRRPDSNYQELECSHGARGSSQAWLAGFQPWEKCHLVHWLLEEFADGEVQGSRRHFFFFCQNFAKFFEFVTKHIFKETENSSLLLYDTHRCKKVRFSFRHRKFLYIHY